MLGFVPQPSLRVDQRVAGVGEVLALRERTIGVPGEVAAGAVAEAPLQQAPAGVPGKAQLPGVRGPEAGEQAARAVMPRGLRPVARTMSFLHQPILRAIWMVKITKM